MVFVITCQSVSDFRRHSRGGGGEAQFTYTHSARLQYFAHCSKATGLVSLHRHCVKNRPRQASHFCIVDFEKAVCFLKRVLLFIIHCLFHCEPLLLFRLRQMQRDLLLYTDKKRPQALSQRTLEFYLVKKEQFPEIRKLLKLNYESEYSKAKLCGKKRRRFTSKKKLYTFILCGSAQMSSFCALKIALIFINRICTNVKRAE